MSIKIKTKKIVPGNGILSRKILEIEMLGKRELPDRYITEGPACWLRENFFRPTVGFKAPVSIKPPTADSRGLRVGSILSEADFRDWLNFLKLCGKKLQSVNCALTLKRNSWHGEETITF